MKCVLRDLSLMRGIENFEKSEIHDIVCKFATFFREKTMGQQFSFDRSRTSRDRSSNHRESPVFKQVISHNHQRYLEVLIFFYQQYMFTIIEILVLSSPSIILSVNLSSAHFHLIKHQANFNQTWKKAELVKNV